MKSFKEIVSESKKVDNSNFRVNKRTVYDLEHKDEFGRWIYHSRHDSEEKALKKIKAAKSELTKAKKFTAADYGPEVGRDRIFDPKYDR